MDAHCESLTFATREKVIGKLSMRAFQPSPVIYLDAQFVTTVYEEASGKEVPIKTIRGNDSSIESSFLTFAGASTKIEREYPISIGKMYTQIAERLDAITAVPDVYPPTALPEIFWVQGVFGLSSTQLSNGNERGSRESIFQFMHTLGDNKFLDLFANDLYFTSGYDQLKRHSAATCGFAINARLLIQLLYLDGSTPVGTPLVIINTGNIS